MRSFEFARKVVDKKLVVDDDNNFVQAFPDAKLPEYSTLHAAGADFFCAEEVVIPSIWKNVFSRILISRDRDKADVDTSGVRDIIIKLFQPTLVHTGIKSNMEEDEVLMLHNRSSNPKKLGLVLANGVGVVDADYYESEDNDGEIMFAFYNFLPWDTKLKVGDKVGQGVFQKYLRPVEGLVITGQKRTGGFGSTDEEGK